MIAAAELRRGQTVRAFHPGRFGVVNHGTVIAIGRKGVTVRVDFGPLLGGTWRVPVAHVVEVLSNE